MSFWRGRWQRNDAGWHVDHFNKNLLKFWPQLVGGRKALRVLVPLCGKSRDLAWFYSQGHSVVGVEGVRQAVDSLFQEEGFEYKVQRIEGSTNKAWRYSTLDNRLVVYVTDFLLVDSDLLGGKFDAVFDRGALEALHLADREPYLQVMRGLMTPDVIYHLSGHLYDIPTKQGPPRPLPLPVVQQLFHGLQVVEVGREPQTLDIGETEGHKVDLVTYHIRGQ